MYTRKQLPKTQYELSKGSENSEFKRHNDIRRDDDSLKGLSIGLFDIDYAIQYYFENVIRPEIVENGSKVKVPVIYGSPEKWKNLQADGYFRDREGKIQSPLIAYKRTAITKNRMLANKVDANYPQLYQTQEVKYTQVNKYDQFSILTNSKPVKTYINTVVPDYVDITYDVVVWTDYIEGMNSIVESIIYSEGTYWGDMERFKFRTKIDSFTNTTDVMMESDRVVRTTFQITLFGHIVPDVLSKNLSEKASEKAFSSRQITIETDADANPEIFNREVASSTSNVDVTYTTPQYRVNAITNYVDPVVLTYINTNKALENPTITVPDTVTFSGNFLTAPAGLPTTSVANFTFFINGTYIEPSAITSFTNPSTGVCVLTLNIAQLGFTLSSSDEIVAIGKFA